MPTDLIVATPAFLDLTFVGLEALPALGEERFAGDLVRSPGGGAITAVAAARLGLQTALVSPLGRRMAFFYDRNGLLVERQDPDGAAWRYDYTAAGRLTSVTDPTGAREEIRYAEHRNGRLPLDVFLEKMDARTRVVSTAYITYGNGYRVDLQGRLGKTVILVVEKPTELDNIHRVSERVRIKPSLGIRARLSSRGAGRWEQSGGDFSKFGLTAAEMVDAVRVMGETMGDHGFGADVAAATASTRDAYDASRAAAAR